MIKQSHLIASIWTIENFYKSPTYSKRKSKCLSIDLGQSTVYKRRA